jgi:hypothetical protein
MGVTLVAPDSIKNQSDAEQITSKDLIDFATKCDAFSRLCIMFLGVVANHITGDAAKPWLDIFQRPLVYPLPADPSPASPDSANTRNLASTISGLSSVLGLVI